MVKHFWFQAQPMTKTTIKKMTEEQVCGVIPFSWKRKITGRAIAAELKGNTHDSSDLKSWY
jgi:hypothetical protein